jgi:hypothetical protein
VMATCGETGHSGNSARQLAQHAWDAKKAKVGLAQMTGIDCCAISVPLARVTGGSHGYCWPLDLAVQRPQQP